MVSEIQELSNLAKDYEGNAVFSEKIKHLENFYSGFYRVRGDGNCWYRSFLFALFDCVARRRDNALALRIENLVMESKDKLVAAGFPEFGLEDFWEILKDECAWLSANFDKVSTEQILAKFNDEDTSNYMVVYLRFLTSYFLTQNREEFIPFVIGLGYFSIEEFVRKEVEPVGREADNIQCIALSKFFNISTRIQYLDNNPGPVEVIDFCSSGVVDDIPLIHLLYRPGHYDVLSSP